MKKHPFKDMTPKKFSPLKTFFYNIKLRIKGDKSPFKQLHKASQETWKCREYDIQGIVVK